jgi:hypothetical protein
MSIAPNLKPDPLRRSGTSRSYGARVGLTLRFYKHLAATRPVQCDSLESHIFPII